MSLDRLMLYHRAVDGLFSTAGGLHTVDSPWRASMTGIGNLQHPTLSPSCLQFELRAPKMTCFLFFKAQRLCPTLCHFLQPQHVLSLLSSSLSSQQAQATALASIANSLAGGTVVASEPPFAIAPSSTSTNSVVGMRFSLRVNCG